VETDGGDQLLDRPDPVRPLLGVGLHRRNKQPKSGRSEACTTAARSYAT
jgi:hypothetical protein